MTFAGLILCLTGSILLMLVFGMSWWKLERPAWHPKWIPILQRAGGTFLFVGFILRVVDSWCLG